MNRPMVRQYTVTEEAGQRLDNFLFAQFRSLPRSRVYRMVRSGEVRVNGGRAKFHTRLKSGDVVRLPPVRTGTSQPALETLSDGLRRQLEAALLYEDDDLLVINKPSGMAVHGGSGISWGLIEALRVMYGPKLELVHRLDRDTSGVLLVARRRSALKAWQVLFRPESRGTHKDYLALVDGCWPERITRVLDPLLRYETAQGERRVRVDGGGKAAHTEFARLAQHDECSVVRATLKTGRTHQIRVHAASRGHPILGDTKYGGPAVDKRSAALSVPRLALHAHRLTVNTPEFRHEFEAPLPEDLARLFAQLGLAI